MHRWKVEEDRCPCCATRRLRVLWCCSFVLIIAIVAAAVPLGLQSVSPTQENLVLPAVGSAESPKGGVYWLCPNATVMPAMVVGSESTPKAAPTDLATCQIWALDSSGYPGIALGIEIEITNPSSLATGTAHFEVRVLSEDQSQEYTSSNIKAVSNEVTLAKSGKATMRFTMTPTIDFSVPTQPIRILDSHGKELVDAQFRAGKLKSIKVYIVGKVMTKLSYFSHTTEFSLPWTFPNRTST
eukprot:gb/GEZN01013602.1/.p1 GENE.gb/GEZN01013602.1/~~gb/GEZN01013602.1/.p1  ORF type:complete len:241 (-),score=17.21 gb/GEZN01013602.1/:247-969(-)